MQTDDDGPSLWLVLAPRQTDGMTAVRYIRRRMGKPRTYQFGMRRSVCKGAKRLANSQAVTSVVDAVEHTPPYRAPWWAPWRSSSQQPQNRVLMVCGTSGPLPDDLMESGAVSVVLVTRGMGRVCACATRNADYILVTKGGTAAMERKLARSKPWRDHITPEHLHELRAASDGVLLDAREGRVYSVIYAP